MANTGYVIYQNLEEYNVDTNVATGNVKPNDPSDPDYVAPVDDSEEPSISCSTTEPSDTYGVGLVSEIDAQTACSIYTTGNTITFYVNNPQNATNEVSAFSQSTELYIDSEGTTFAGQGWYSNGAQARKWNGTAFVGGIFCEI